MRIMTHPLVLDRGSVLGFRRRTGSLDRRLPPGPASLRTAAWAGLQDSVPRAAVLSLHARVQGVGPLAWADPSLVQLWGPRYAVFVVAAEDRGIFSLGAQSDLASGRARSEQLADLLEAHLAGGREGYADAGHAIGVDPVSLRYTGASGRTLVRWEGAGKPLVWTVPRPDIDPFQARLELARRYLHVNGPASAQGFGWWAALAPGSARAVFDALAPELLAVRTPAGEAWALASDEPALRAPAGPPEPVRLLSSGDPYLLAGDRETLVEDPANRHALWPNGTVWPGGVMVEGEMVGTWRRSGRRMTIRAWRPLTAGERQAVEADAADLPLPDPGSGISVTWEP
jgi:hypothetical protein